jgi:hypothetical protein
MLNVETDPSVIADLRGLLGTGYKMPIPFVNQNRQADGVASTSKAITVRITPDMGFAVKRLVYAPFASVETSNTALDHSNVTGPGDTAVVANAAVPAYTFGTKIVSYQTQLDSVQRQQYLLDCKTNLDDWQIHRWLMSGTAIQNANIYAYNWVHVEDFSGLSVERLREVKVAGDNIVSGIPIVGSWGTEHIWTITATTANAAFNHYTFIITYKTLVVGPSGIDVVNVDPHAVSA